MTLGLKDLEMRIRLPWKENPREARRIYMQIIRSENPEETLRELKKSLNGR